MKSYTFHVSIPGTGRVWRKIELLDDQTLAQLHLAIQDAFDFDDDHLYSFFMSGKAWDGDTEYNLPDDIPPAWPVEATEDEMEDEPKAEDDPWADYEAVLRQKVEAAMQQPGLDERQINFLQAALERVLTTRFKEPGDVRKTRLADLNLKKGQKFMYLFDYGDEWRFRLRLHAVNESAAADAEYPRVVESVGQPPDQYGGWDDEW